MAKYEVSKISMSNCLMDGAKCYDYSKYYDTWAELTADMADRDRCANEMFYDRGSDIFCDDKIIGNIKDFYNFHDKPIRRVTLTEFQAQNAE